MSYTILVALDESAWSQAALTCALRIAARAPAEIELIGLHVINVTHITGQLLHDIAGMLGFEPVVVPEQVEAMYRKRGERLLEGFTTLCVAHGVRGRAVLEQGAVVRTVLQHAARCDLVVLGARGETEETYVGQGGSTMEQVARRSPTSVLVVNREAPQFNGVTVGYDGSDGANLALREVRRLVELLKIPVAVWYVADGRRPPGHDPTEEAARYLEEKGITVTHGVVEGEAHEALVVQAGDAQHDVLALGYRGRSLLKELVLGRVTERLLGQLAMAVFVAH